MKPIIPDVLAERYASTPMVRIWAPEGKILAERRLWIAVLKAQKDLGLSVPDGAIELYEEYLYSIDLRQIRELEVLRRHDVKARTEAFNMQAGHQLIHKGFTSRDLTDNVELLQAQQALKLVRDHAVAVLSRLGVRAAEYAILDISGRSHNVPGQTVTLGKRFANVAEEMLVAFELIEHVIANFPLRGMKGAMGTSQDMISLLGSIDKARELEDRVRKHLGFEKVFDSVGQVYPRSLDFEIVSALAQLSAGPSNFTQMVRLMAGYGQMIEGFSESQTGSTAQPHKRNSRTSERIKGLARAIGGYLSMLQANMGDQWFEGDVSCSVVRRVAIQGAFLAIDGLLEATLTILGELEVYPYIIAAELKQYLPFLSTSALLMAAIKKDRGREEMHEVIKKSALTAIQNIQQGRPSTLAEDLAQDPAFPLDIDEISKIISTANHGDAEGQVSRVCSKIAEVCSRYPKEALYQPEPIL
jgi:adenylosuccinate lyase